MLFRKQISVLNGYFEINSGFAGAYFPSATDVILTTVGDTSNGNINSWVEWDNYNKVWKVYCSDSSYNGIVHCTIHTN